MTGRLLWVPRHDGEEILDSALPIVDSHHHLWDHPKHRCFGPERCMFESNFPVDKVSASYRVLWNSFKRIVAGSSAAEKAALFHDTAARVYRL